jgi:hypothetical protein
MQCLEDAALTERVRHRAAIGSRAVEFYCAVSDIHSLRVVLICVWFSCGVRVSSLSARSVWSAVVLCWLARLH